MSSDGVDVGVTTTTAVVWLGVVLVVVVMLVLVPAPFLRAVSGVDWQWLELVPRLLLPPLAYLAAAVRQLPGPPDGNGERHLGRRGPGVQNTHLERHDGKSTS